MNDESIDRKLSAIETSVQKLMLIEELLVSSLDSTSKKTQDISSVMQMSADDLRKLRETFLENGISARVDNIAKQISEVKEDQRKLKDTFDGLFVKLLIAVISLSVTSLAGIAVSLVLGIFSK
jgi:hypothetical protein